MVCSLKKHEAITSKENRKNSLDVQRGIQINYKTWYHVSIDALKF
jgi:hypothetical protein